MIKLGDKEISDIKLGATNVVSVYQGDTLIWPPRPKGTFTLVYTTTSANQSVKLTSRKQYFEYIETEDGVEDLSGSGTLNHTFVNVGEHEVKVLFKKGLTIFESCFSYCNRLTSIPSDLFTNNPEVTSFVYCFNGCTGLTSIPSNLFANNPKVINFNYCFYGCRGLTSIPEELFANNTKAADFECCFYNCSGLTSISEGLFANNTKAANFRSCFKGCTGLTSIPSDLFANNTQVTIFENCFNGCTGLTSSTPLDNDGTPLYNRSRGKEGYSAVTRHTGCFSGCTLMSDYSSIPSDWR